MFFSEFAVLAVATTGTFLLFLIMIYYILALADLECDYMNPQECCSKLNMLFPLKMLVQSILTVFLLVHRYWLLAFMNVPMLMWMFNELQNVRPTRMGVYDPIEMYNRGQIGSFLKQFVMHAAYFLTLSTIYAYFLFVEHIKDEKDFLADQYQFEIQIEDTATTPPIYLRREYDMK